MSDREGHSGSEGTPGGRPDAADRGPRGWEAFDLETAEATVEDPREDHAGAASAVDEAPGPWGSAPTAESALHSRNPALAASIPPPPQPPLTAGRAAASVSGTPAAPSPGAAVRDRIVVLGRRKAGKTIFLARLYEQLWRSESRLHMKAVDGNDHLFFMETLRVLSERVWPPATGSSTRIRVEVTDDRGVRMLSVLDYSGEVFKRAFLERPTDAPAEEDDPDTRELLEHLDRAAAVILLIDPGIVINGTAEEIAEDEFGMTAAVRRIRRGPGGSHIPIALVLTKLDLHGRMVRECGGLVGFVKRHLFPLLRALHRVRVFGCVAVRSRPDALGQQRPDPQTPPLGVLEPLQFCLAGMVAPPRTETVGPTVRAGGAAPPMRSSEPPAEDSTTPRGGRGAMIAAIAVSAIVVLTIVAIAIALSLQAAPGGGN
jgi:hypothetical protein